MKAFPKGTIAKDINAKVGDKFRVVEPSEADGYEEGDIVTLDGDVGGCLSRFKTKGGIKSIYWYELAPLTRDLDHLQEGDVLVSKSGYEYMVLGICGKVVFLSYGNHLESFSHCGTAAQLKREGYTLKDATSATTELTVAEVAQKLGYKPGELRIKE